MTIQDLSDKDLYSLCKKYGEQALYWRRKFIGLLPEVEKRGLYKDYGFNSIFEFAAKLAGISQNQVRLSLNLEKRFEDKKILHELLVNGEVSVNKLSKIASIATTENQECLAKQAETLSCRALETLAKDERLTAMRDKMTPSEFTGLHVQNSNLQQSTINVKNDREQLNLSIEVQQRLLELQKKGIDINQLLTEFLDKREANIKQEKKEIAEKLAEKAAQSKHVPAMVERVIQREYGTKCSIPTCNRPAEHLHHTLRFALSRSHDPHYIAPLCKEHHLIAHSIDMQFQKMRQRKHTIVPP